MKVSDKLRADFLEVLTSSRNHQHQILKSFYNNYDSSIGDALQSRYISIFLWDIIYFVAAGNFRNRNISVSDIYLSLGVSKSTAIRCVAMLEEAGILEKARDPDDRRRAVISLSAEFRNAFVPFIDRIYGDISSLSDDRDSC